MASPGVLRRTGGIDGHPEIVLHRCQLPTFTEYTEAVASLGLGFYGGSLAGVSTNIIIIIIIIIGYLLLRTWYVRIPPSVLVTKHCGNILVTFW